jgi:hypothetical protein
LFIMRELFFEITSGQTIMTRGLLSKDKNVIREQWLLIDWNWMKFLPWNIEKNKPKKLFEVVVITNWSQKMI